jgi:hypothetical protein
MVNVQVDESVAAMLSAKAAAQGLTVAAYLESLLLSPTTEPAPTISVDEFDRLLDEEAMEGRSPAGTFSRDELYSDHD